MAFSSPLNCHFTTQPREAIYTLYPDVDRSFGSRGSFLAGGTTGGVYVVNPPYSAPLLQSTATRVLTALEGGCESREAPSRTFYIYLPHWTDDEGISRLMKSSYCRYTLAIREPHAIHDMFADKLITLRVPNLFLVLSNDTAFSLDRPEELAKAVRGL